MSEHRSGFVSIVGRPNTGKSTLLNALVGEKVAIVSEKPQTTRTTIQGVLTTAGAQIVFLDTPGIHRSDTLLNRRMMDSVREALDQRDLVLFVADASASFSEHDTQAVDLVRRVEAPVFLVLNKIDRVSDKRLLLPCIEQYKALREFADYLPVSALTGEGIEDLTRSISAALPEGPEYFPPDHVTDQPSRFLAAELIREKILAATRQEVPHAVAVIIDEWDEKRRLLRISATVLVEREGQKGIIIGAKGAMLKTIGTQAREEIERILSRRVFLQLHVKVHPGWRENPQFLGAVDWRDSTRSEE
ncbi:MAG TPA: GTPase Era [Bryobacteraceae bacterium]|nr:GTPase Era [Bryobacteraceae bacterium]